jgi:hypothetical protein
MSNQSLFPSFRRPMNFRTSLGHAIRRPLALAAVWLAWMLLPVALGFSTESSTSNGTDNKRVLLIHDGAKAVQPLAEFLKAQGHFDVTLVDQAHLPPAAEWAGFRAVLGYIHNRLLEPTELAIIEYTKNGGRFVALHHMISSGKAANRFYFDFLGVRLDSPQMAKDIVVPGAGYGWFTGADKGVEVTLVNLNPKHFIVSHNVQWSARVQYQSSDQLTVPAEYPAIVMPKAEAYMNHKFTDGREKTVLCGMSYLDPRTGTRFEQDRSAWFKSYGTGKIFYFQSGHFVEEYANANIAQMILNAIVWDGQ